MNTMKYNGYTAIIEYDDVDKILVGHLAGIKDIVSFHGSNVQSLESGFHDAVDGYLEISEKTGRAAQKPFSGNLMLRIDPEIHAAVATAAEISGKSINQWAALALDQAAHH